MASPLPSRFFRGVLGRGATFPKKEIEKKNGGGGGLCFQVLGSEGGLCFQDTPCKRNTYSPVFVQFYNAST